MSFELIVAKFGDPFIAIPPHAPQWRMALLKLTDGISVSGKGATDAIARQSCLGEAAEILSAKQRDDDDEFCAIDLETGTKNRISANLVTIVDSGLADDPGSEGCAAGSSLTMAISGALLERIERHSVARWWKGNFEGKRISAQWIEKSGLASVVAEARENSDERRETGFISLENVAGVSTIIAFSTLGDGTLPVLGFASSSDPFAAARNAFAELVQMEFGLFLAIGAARHEKLSDSHRRLFSRCWALETKRHGLLNPSDIVHPTDSCGCSISEIASKLPGTASWVDLSRKDVGIPVVRVVTNELEGARSLKFTEDGGPL